MSEFLETIVSGPIVVATTMLLICCLYWIVVLISGLGLDVLDVDLDFDADADSVLSFGMVTLRWFNIGNVPIMVWFTVFSLTLWVFFRVFDRPGFHESLWQAAVALVCAAMICAVITKVFTQPLKGKFDLKEPAGIDDLIGAIAVIKTPEVTRTSGQAEIKSEAAPLLLNVRTIQGVLAKGEQARVVDYDEESHAYLIERVGNKEIS